MTRADNDNVDVVNNGGNSIMEFTPGAEKLLMNDPISPAGTKPAHPHAPWMSSTGKFMVTPNVNLDTTSILDMDTGKHVDKPAGHWPIAQGMMPDNSKYYTANFLDGTMQCTSIAAPACHDGPNLVDNMTIDLMKGYDWITGDHPGPLGGIPIQSPVSPDGRTLLIANTLTGTVGVVDTATDTFVKTLPCDAGCHGINFGAKKGGGYYGYVSSKFANTMEVIDVSNGPSAAEVVGKFTVDAQPTTAVDDPVVSYSGFGGMGVLAVPVVYNGYVQNVPTRAPFDQLTCQQRHPLTYATDCAK